MECNCEHTNHFNDQFGPQVSHDYASVPAGTQQALYVGSICDICAIDCMSDYLLPMTVAAITSVAI